MTEKGAKDLLAESLAIEAEHLKLRQAYLPKFRGVLSDTMLARYYQLENKIDAVIDFDLARNIPLVKQDDGWLA
jgi:hypothetical protein